MKRSDRTPFCLTSKTSSSVHASQSAVRRATRASIDSSWASALEGVRKLTPETPSCAQRGCPPAEALRSEPLEGLIHAARWRSRTSNASICGSYATIRQASGTRYQIRTHLRPGTAPPGRSLFSPGLTLDACVGRCAPRSRASEPARSGARLPPSPRPPAAGPASGCSTLDASVGRCAPRSRASQPARSVLAPAFALTASSRGPRSGCSTLDARVGRCAPRSRAS